MWMARRFIYFKNVNRSLKDAAPKWISKCRFDHTGKAFAPHFVQN